MGKKKNKYKNVDEFLKEVLPGEYNLIVKRKKSKLRRILDDADYEFKEKLDIILDIGKTYETPEDYDENARQIYFKVGTNTAIEKLSEGIIKFPESKALLRRRSHLLCILKKYQEAVDDANKIIKMDPKDASAYNAKAYYLNFMEKSDEAIMAVNKAIKLEPNTGSYYDTRATSYKHKKDFEKALKDYNKAVELELKLKEEDRDEEIFFNRGDLHELMGNFEAARADFEAALKIEPDYEVCEKRLKELMEKHFNSEIVNH